MLILHTSFLPMDIIGKADPEHRIFKTPSSMMILLLDVLIFLRSCKLIISMPCFFIIHLIDTVMIFLEFMFQQFEMAFVVIVEIVNYH